VKTLHTTTVAPPTLAPGQRPLPRLAWIVVASCVLTGAACLLLECDGWYTSRALIVAAAWPWAIPFVGSLRELIGCYVHRAERVLQIDLDGDGSIGPIRDLAFSKNALPADRLPQTRLPNGARYADVDLHYLLDRLAAVGKAGPSWREWADKRLPSGRVLADYDQDFRLFAEFLADLGAVDGRKSGSAGKVVMEPREIKARMGLK
jgi:hypothetical protein